MITILRPARPIQPGRILRHELKAWRWTRMDLRRRLRFRLAEVEIANLERGEIPVTPITAELLALAFGTSPEFWLNLQWQYDEAMASKEEK